MNFKIPKLVTLTVATSMLGCSSNIPDPGTKSNFDLGMGYTGRPVSLWDRYLTEGEIVGVYGYEDGFWRWELHIFPNHKVGLFYITDNLTEDGFETGTHLFGDWSLDDNELEIYDGEKRIWRIFKVGNRIAIMEAQKRNDRYRIYVEKKHPILEMPQPVDGADGTR
jgi:hypothetical protein